MKTIQFDSLQCFRGVAALAIVLHHAGLSTNAFIESLPAVFNYFCHISFLGVDFFFVLSGFIILNSHLSDEKNSRALKRYLIKRFIRIFPAYWLISALLILCYTLLPTLSQGTRTEFSLLSSLLLLPATAPPVLSVAWTLIYEVMFYIIFVTFFISLRLFITVVCVWISVISLNFLFTHYEPYSPWLKLILNPINSEFIFGMMVAYLAKIVSPAYRYVLIFFAIISFIIFLYCGLETHYRFLWGLPFSCLLLGAVLLERQQKLSLPYAIIALGEAKLFYLFATQSLIIIHQSNNSLYSSAYALVARVINRHSDEYWLRYGLSLFY